MLLGYPLVAIDPNRALSDWYFRRIGKALVRINPAWNVRVEGREKLAEGGPFVLVVNHQSMADLIAMCFLGHPTKYLGKEAVFRVPVLGWALRIAGQVPVERGNKQSGSKALAALGEWLDRRVSVALFPEGTRTDDGTIGPFKLGGFRLAVDHGRAVVPVVIAGARDLLPKHSVLFERSADVHVRVLDPVLTDGMRPEDVPALAERVRKLMIDELAAMEAGR
jgi:1-acyl-sn-glycerol-3-phosphate acyltransferase